MLPVAMPSTNPMRRSRIDGVAVIADGLAARKYHILHVTCALIRGFRANPRVSRCKQISGDQDQRVPGLADDAPRCRVPHAVVNREPSFSVSIGGEHVQSCLASTIRRAEPRA